MPRFDSVFIEISNICNFRCSFCPLDLQTRKMGMMSKEKAIKIINYLEKDKITNKIKLFLWESHYLTKIFFI
jgi:sulfatase maturation enzyme AslB (radical SAM superfamily)